MLRDADRRRRGVGRARRRAADPRGFVPFDRELSVVAVRGRDGATRVLAARRERAPRRHPARQPRAGARRRRRRSRPQARRSPRASSTTSTTSACSPSSCSSTTARCSPTRSRRACTTPATGRSKARRRASSRTTSARCSAGRSARPRRAGTRRWSTASARCPTATRSSAVPGAHLHDYGKAPRPGRKVGHVTVVAPDDADARRAPRTRVLARSSTTADDG